MNSRLCSARSSASRRRHAGSTFRNVYLTKCRSRAMDPSYSRGRVVQVRLGIVSPYSWTYPGGVNRHVEALARELLGRGHDVRVFAPFDRDTRRTAALHRGARPSLVEVPEWLVPLGGTIGWPANGAVSNLPFHPTGVSTL